MRFRVGLILATAATLAVCACTSSSGGKKAKSGAGWFEVRPLIMPGQEATQVQAHPLAALHLPADEKAYAALTEQQQAALKAGLRGVDCAHPPTVSGGSERIVCDTDSDVFLLGQAIFTGNDVTSARPLPATDSDPQWSLGLSLTPPSAAKLHRWTTRYHVLSEVGAYNDVQTSSREPCGAGARTPCSDFLAYISHQTVVTSTVSYMPTDSVITVLGAFNERSATRLAHKIAG
jgi:hypothetical protein